MVYNVQVLQLVTISVLGTYRGTINLQELRLQQISQSFSGIKVPDLGTMLWIFVYIWIKGNIIDKQNYKFRKLKLLKNLLSLFDFFV